MRIRYGFYKDGKRKALTMSYDDGQLHDLRLIEIFNRYGIKGTFHLNAAKVGKEKFVSEEDVRTAYVGHEVSCHSFTHPFLENVPAEEVVFEMMEDRKKLESLCGYVVRGMSYPMGTYSKDLIARLRTLGIKYSRTTNATYKWYLPEDFMTWHPTCHHTDEKLFSCLDSFLNYNKDWNCMPLLYVWGHSYEFPRDDNWDKIETFCEKAGGKDDVWYATNIELYDYVTAMWSIELSADRTMAYNPTATDVWLSVENQPVKCPAGQTTKLI